MSGVIKLPVEFHLAVKVNQIKVISITIIMIKATAIGLIRSAPVIKAYLNNTVTAISIVYEQ